MYFCVTASKWLIVIVILFLVFQCKSVDPHANSEKELQNVFIENVGTDYHTVLNESKTFILCVQNIPFTQVGRTPVNYLVVDRTTNQVMTKGKFLNGHCKWNDDSSIEVVDMPGAIKENQSPDFKKIIAIKKPKL